MRFATTIKVLAKRAIRNYRISYCVVADEELPDALPASDEAAEQLPAADQEPTLGERVAALHLDEDQVKYRNSAVFSADCAHQDEVNCASSNNFALAVPIKHSSRPRLLMTEGSFVPCQ